MRKVSVWVALGLIASLSMPVSSSAAGNEQTYSVSGCSVGGRTFSPDGWAASSVPASARAAVDDCTASGKMGFDLEARSDAVGWWTFSAPRGTSVVAVSLYDLAGSADPHHQVLIRTVRERDERQSAFAVAGLVSLPSPFSIGIDPARSVLLGLQCSIGCAGTASIRATRIVTTLQDVSAPTVAFDASKQVFRFADVGGGVASAELEIDGRVRHLALGGEPCREPFALVVPCPTSGELVVADEHLAPGYRTIFATVTDAAGNRGYAGPYVIGFAPPPPAPANPTAISRPTSTVTVDGPSRVRVGYREFKLAGVVRDADAYPLAGVSVSVMARSDGEAWRPLPSVKTDVHGRFSVIVPKGPSREVRVSYKESSQSVRVVVAAPVQLSSDRTTTRNGRTITFKGRIPEAEDGRIRVILQALARGKWLTFKTVGLRRGRFSARYRFTGTLTTTRYRFRAVVDEQPDLPFGGGTSAVLRVLVRPARSRA